MRRLGCWLTDPSHRSQDRPHLPDVLGLGDPRQQSGYRLVQGQPSPHQAQQAVICEALAASNLDVHPKVEEL